MRKGISLITGLVLLIIGFTLFYYRVSKIKAGIVTIATVLRVDSKRNGKNMLYRPVLQFTNYKKELMIFKADYSVNNWYPGEKAKILYSKYQYDTISILSYWGTFGLELSFFCGALVFLFIAGGEYWARHFFNTLKKPID